MRNFRTYVHAGLAALALLALPLAAYAQTVSQQPQFAKTRTLLDLGNGPLEIKMLGGSMGIATSFNSGVGSTSGSSTTLTLTASAAATPPCVGCLISGTGITSGTTIAAFNGTTGITLSAAMTVAASTPVAWGVACPATLPAASPVVLIQVGVGGDIPLYTQARICAYGQQQAGGSFVTFAIGAH